MTFVLRLLFVPLLLGTLSLFFLTDHSLASKSRPEAIKADTAFACGTDPLHATALREHGAYRQRHEAMEAALLQRGARKRGAQADYVLPVVVHIIHQNGAENISDVQALAAIQHLNQSYANQGYYDQGTGVNTQIQFCLAKRNPDGQATTGITRVESPLTEMTLETEDIALKDLDRWAPTQYINIWLVREICSLSSGCGVAGYAYLPSAHGMPMDGIVMEAEYFGSSEAASTVLTHEMGHYLGLYHTFQGGCQNDDCLQDGDRVCDTPPDQTTAGIPCNGSMNSCFTDANSGFAADQDDMFFNYMDYGDLNCYSALTQGQTDRMHFFIEEVRSSLLDSEACLDPCTQLIEAVISPSAVQVEVGQSVFFTNNSTGATTYEWLLQGSPVSTDTDFSQFFDQEGAYEVILWATNGDPNCSGSDTVVVEVICPVEAAFDYSLAGPQISVTNNSQNATAYTWVWTDDVGNSQTFTGAAPGGISAPSPGWYSLCLQASSALCADTLCQSIFIAPGGGFEGQVVQYLGDAADNKIDHLLYHPGEKAFFLSGSRREGNGPSQATLTKVDECGEILWSRGYFEGVGERTAAQDMVVMEDENILMSGLISQQEGTSCCKERVIMKIDVSNGDIINSISFGNNARLSGDNDMVRSIGDPDGEAYYLVHWYSQTPPSNDDPLVSKINGDGDLIWQKRYDNNADDEISDILALPNGELALVGLTASQRQGVVFSIDYQGNEKLNYLYSAPGSSHFIFRSIASYQNGYIVAGGIRFGGGGYDQFYGIMDENWNLTQIQYLDAPFSASFSRVEVDAYNQVYWMSRIEKAGVPVLHVSKINNLGQISWTKSIDVPTEELIGSPSYGISSAGTTEEKILLWDNASEPSGLGEADMFMGVFDTTLNSCITSEESIVLQTLSGITRSNISFEEEPLNFSYGTEQAMASLDYSSFSKCSNFSVCTEICDNGLDDDGDGLVDCEDPECGCEECEHTFVNIFGTPGVVERANSLLKIGPNEIMGCGAKGDSALLFIVSLNGDLKWSKTYKFTSGDNEIHNIHLDSEGFVIGAGFGRGSSATNWRGFAFRLNTKNLALEWSRTITSQNLGSRFYDLFEKAPGGNYFLTGQTNGNSAPGLSVDGFWAELDRNTGGLVKGPKSYNLGSAEDFVDFSVAGDALFVGGRYNLLGAGFMGMRPGLTRLDMDGNEIWTRLYITPPSSSARLYNRQIEIDNGGIIVSVVGDKNGTSASNPEVFLFKTNFDGDLVWTKEYHFGAGSNMDLVHFEPTGEGYYLYGADQTSGTLFLLKTNKEGDLLWAKRYSAPFGLDAGDYNRELIENNGFLFFIGNTIAGNSQEDIILLKTDSQGNLPEGCFEVEEFSPAVSDLTNPYSGFHSLTVYDSPVQGLEEIVAENNTTLPEEKLCTDSCSTEICDNGLDDDGDGLVDCYDEDCFCDTVCADFYYGYCDTSCVQSQYDSTFSLREKWANQSQYCVYNVPKVGDIDKDGIPEIVVFQFKENTNSLHVVDGLTGEIEVEIPVGTAGDNRFSSTAIADLDKNDDGFGEILYTNASNRIFCFNHDGTLRWQTPPISLPGASTQIPQINVADFDGDGLPEVYFNATIVNGQDGTVMGQGSGSIGATPTQVVSLGFTVAMDVLPDSLCPACMGAELVAGNMVYTVEIDPVAKQATINPEVTIPSQGDGLTSIADWDQDGDLDAVVTRRINAGEVRLYVWELQAPNLIGSTDLPVAGANATGIAQVSDIDGDQELEAVFCSNYRLFGVDNDFTSLWVRNVDDESGLTGLTAFDFNNDGKTELVYRDEEAFQILEGTNGEILASEPCFSPTGQEYPVVADADADGSTEILIVCSEVPYVKPGADPQFRGSLTMYASDAKPWVSARSVWNQYSYFNTHINDDLSVPPVIQAAQLVGDSLEMNSFLRQYARPLSPVPDAELEVMEVSCQGNDSLKVDLIICNNGESSLSYETPLSVYAGNPLTATAQSLLTIMPLLQNLPVDSCRTVSLVLPLISGTYFFIINDDASLTPPFDPVTNFPVTSIAECNYANNTDSLSFNFDTPELDLGPDTTLCHNGALELNAGAGFTSYEWQDGWPDSTYTVFASGTYWVKVTDACGNMQTDTVVVQILPPTVLEVEPDTLLCVTDTVFFDLPAPFAAWQWYPDTGLDCADCPQVGLLPGADETYVIVANTAEGCYSTDTLWVEEKVDTTFLGSFTCNPLDSGTVTVVLENQFGCDSVVIDGVLYIPPDTTVLIGTSCNPADTGVTVQTLNNQFGCDSLVISQIGLLPSDSVFLSSGSCNPADTGLFVNVYTNQYGCDSTVTEQVVLWPTDTTVLQATSCNPQDTGWMQTVLSNQFGCDSVLLTYTALLPSSLTIVDTLLCENESIVVENQSLSAGDTLLLTYTNQFGCDSLIEWRAGLVDTFLDQSIIAICEGDSALIFGNFETIAGVYSQTFTSQAGCDSTEQIILQVNPLPAADGQVFNTCAGQNNGRIELQVNAAAPYSIAWAHTPQDVDVLDMLAPGLYAMTLTDANGCQISRSYEVLAQPPPEWALLTGNIRCWDGADGFLQVLHDPADNLMFSLNGGAFQADALFSGLTAGFYDLAVMDSLGCVYDTLDVQLLQPFAWTIFVSADTVEVKYGESVLIETQTGAGDPAYQWSPPELVDCDTCPQVNASPLTDTVLTLIVTDSVGCMDTVRVRVQIDNECQAENLAIPNVFTPNDDGVNDHFEVMNKLAAERVQEFKIFDRWGELIFEGAGQDARWDGSFRGKPMPPDVYVYLIRYRCANGKEGLAAGDVTLVR